MALYWAKASDEPAKAYAEDQYEYTIDRLALAAQLRRGIDRGELVVDYQPKVALHASTTFAVEALVRWEHPQLGRLSPAAFVPLAEQSGVIKYLTERVLETSLRQCARWRDEGLLVRVSVNVSTRSLLDRDLPAVIRELLECFDVPASLLQLEITESRTVTDLGRAQAVLEELRSMGVTVAIDDFGTGFSSLSQLQQLPIDEIKIDRSFVISMDEDRNDAMLVRSIIELGRSLDLRVTAEGVETESSLQTLRQLGCDFAQGFHLCRPVRADPLPALFRDCAGDRAAGPDRGTGDGDRMRRVRRMALAVLLGCGAGTLGLAGIGRSTSQSAPAVAGTVALCINDNGVNGPCAGLTPAQIIAKIRSQAASYATTTNGFAGDPAHPISGKYFGYLDYAGAY